MTYDLPRIATFSVLTLAFISLGIMWVMFFAMYLSPDEAVELRANDFNEFWLEFVLLTLGIILTPVALYELDEQL